MTTTQAPRITWPVGALLKGEDSRNWRLLSRRRFRGWYRVSILVLPEPRIRRLVAHTVELPSRKTGIISSVGFNDHDALRMEERSLSRCTMLKKFTTTKVKPGKALIKLESSMNQTRIRHESNKIYCETALPLGAFGCQKEVKKRRDFISILSSVSSLNPARTNNHGRFEVPVLFL